MVLLRRKHVRLSTSMVGRILNDLKRRGVLVEAEEFYQVIPDRWNVTHLNPQLRRWEHIYNTVRPHQALHYLTPLEFLQRWKSHKQKAKCH